MAARIKHHCIDDLAHALACNSGGMSEAGHKHLMECAREVAEWWNLKPFNFTEIRILEQKLSIAREALEFYASPWGLEYGFGNSIISDKVKKVLDDSRLTAIEALEKLK